MTNLIERLFWSSRPISWINTAFPFAASYWVITGSIDITWIVGTLFFLIPYNLLMYGVNDVFDFESDQQNPRKTGSEGIVLEKRFHKKMLIIAPLINIPFVIVLVLLGNMTSGIVLAITLAMVIAYSAPVLRFKEKPLLDSVTSAAHFTGPMLFGLTIAGWDNYYLFFVLSFFAWGMASHMFGAVQDILPDRQAKIASIATVLGARWTVRLAAVFYLVSSELLLVKGRGPMIVGLLGLVYVINILPFWDLKDSKSQRANRGWKRFMKLNYLVGFVITILLLRNYL